MSSVHTDVQLAPTEKHVTLVLMRTETQPMTVNVTSVIMMTVLPNVKNVTTDVILVPMVLLVTLVMI
jgi:hypothetical protein